MLFFECQCYLTITAFGCCFFPHYYIIIIVCFVVTVVVIFAVVCSVHGRVSENSHSDKWIGHNFWHGRQRMYVTEFF